MENQSKLPFKVGDLAEARSFEKGYRGAWFRCKILQYRKRKEACQHALEYYDFPDEATEWADLYKVPYHILGRGHKKYTELMLRPSYPPIFNSIQIPDINSISQISVIIDGTWKIGDIVDWWFSSSYWTGEIIELLSDDIARIELLRPPLGEGSLYEASFNDLRPSLHWSPIHGWEMPPQKDSTAKPSAWLIKPTTQVTPACGTNREADFVQEAISSNSIANSDELKSEWPKQGIKDSQEAKKDVQRESTSTMFFEVEAPEKGLDFGNSAEEAVLDLQRCLNRVKLLRAILLKSMSSPVTPITPQHRWMFVEPSYSSDDPDTPNEAS